MSKIEDIINELDTFKRGLQQYLSYDYNVGGIVSKSIKNLEEAQQLLQQGAAENRQEALSKLETVKQTLSPYQSYAPAMLNAFNAVLEKIHQYR